MVEPIETIVVCAQQSFEVVGALNPIQIELKENVDKNLDEYKKALVIKDKQLSDIKKILITAKKSYDKVVPKNKELRNYIENIKQRYNQYQQQQQAQYIWRERDYYTEKQPKKYKRVIYREELEGEPEV